MSKVDRVFKVTMEIQVVQHKELQVRREELVLKEVLELQVHKVVKEFKEYKVFKVHKESKELKVIKEAKVIKVDRVLVV